MKAELTRDYIGFEVDIKKGEILDVSFLRFSTHKNEDMYIVNGTDIMIPKSYLKILKHKGKI